MTVRKRMHLLALLLLHLCGGAHAHLHARTNVPAPDGYHWQMNDGKFSLSPNKNLADSLPPISYDPKTGGFKDADGKPFTGDVSAIPVRGTDLDGFTKSVDGLGADPITAKQAYDLFAKKDWPALEKLFTEKGLNGGWPPNRGFINVKDGVLAAGSQFDRFGGYTDSKTGEFKDSGQFVANYGDNFPGRALPQSYIDGDGSGGGKKPLNGYIVLKDIPVKTGEAIPWFGQPGGNPQHELPKGGIDKLIADGYIKRIDAPDLNAPKTDGDVKPDVDGNDGGGMKGKDVYPLAKTEAESIAKMTPDEVAKAVQDAAGRKGKLPDGAKVTPTGKAGIFTMTIPDPKFPNDPKKAKSIELVVNTNFDPSKAKTGHGDDQGAAMNTITVKDGKITATVELGGAHSKADADKMMAHELGEIADIAAQIESRKAADPKASDADLQKLVTEQQQASVFKDGGKGTEADMTAHDRAVVAEISALADNVKNAPDPAAAKEATDKLRKLAESMGIKSKDDPRIAIIEKTTGRLNGEQLAAVSGMQKAPDGYRWIRNADGTMDIENVAGKHGEVLHYDPATDSFKPNPGALPLVPSKKSTEEFSIGDTKSEKKNPKDADSNHEVNVSRDTIAAREVEIDSDRARAIEKVNARLKEMGLQPLTITEGKGNAGEILKALEAKRKEVQDKRGPRPEKPADDAPDTVKDAYEAWKKQNATVAMLSEQIGEVSSKAAIEGMNPKLTQLPSTLPGDGKQGQFDLVFIDDKGNIVIVESKGGSAELGTKKGKDERGNDVDLQQGTPEYLEAIVSNMERVAAETGDSNLRATARKIRAAMAASPPKVQYLHASQKIDSDGSAPPDLNITKFDVEP